MNIKKFILHPIAKPKPKIDSSKIFFEKKKCSYGKKIKMPMNSPLALDFQKIRLDLRVIKIKNNLNLSKSIFF